jgi:hypothetical protein
VEFRFLALNSERVKKRRDSGPFLRFSPRWHSRPSPMRMWILRLIETGLGGRLDCTNVLEPRLSIIASIGWDHMAVLGNTKEEIAREKAGIIKHSVPVVIGPQEKEFRKAAMGEFRRAATDKGARILLADNLVRTRVLKESFAGTAYEVSTGRSKSLIRWDKFGPGSRDQLENNHLRSQRLARSGILQSAKPHCAKDYGNGIGQDDLRLHHPGRPFLSTGLTIRTPPPRCEAQSIAWRRNGELSG